MRKPTTRRYKTRGNRKPYALTRAQKGAGYIANCIRLQAVRAEIKAGTTIPEDGRIDYYTRNVKRGRTRTYITRPGRFFHCQYCGTRMAASATVYSKTEKTTEQPAEILCLDCAHARGYDVLTSERYANTRNPNELWRQCTHVQ